MFIFLLQIRHIAIGSGPLYLFAVFSAIVWLLWFIKVDLSRRYRAWTEPYRTTTSVIVPVVDEPADMFREVLDRIVAQQPTELIVVVNGPRNHRLEAVCAELGVGWIWTPKAGKRNAIRLGVEAATGDIVVLVDSDTVWTAETLAELVKPFADAAIGGVTTRQRILDHDRCLITRWADWLENTRALYMMPAQSVLGHVGCLPGRTIAFRREILQQIMDRFLTERFLGVFLEISDDRTLTNLTLRAGYRTAYQVTSLVYTEAPTTVRRLYRQQLRWARGSQYNTLRMLPWMLTYAPMLAVFFLADIILPFLLLGVGIGWAYRAATGTGANLYAAILKEYGMQAGLGRVVALALVASMLSMGVRQLRHLSERPSDFLRLPAFILVSTLFLMPVRLLGFFRMAHVSGWGTRAHAYGGTDHDAAAAVAGTQRTEVPHPAELVRAGSVGEVAPVTAGGGAAGEPAGDRLADPAGPPGPGAQAARPSAGHQPARVRWRPNPQAAWPYLIGSTLIVLEVLHHA